MRFFDASTHAEAEIPFEVVADAVAELTREVDRVVVIGAVARDLLASLAGGLLITRATKDVDIAIAVSDLHGFASATASLEGTRSPHRFQFRGVPIDVIPFGSVERDRAVLFANDFSVDVTGLAEAADTAVSVLLPGGSVVPVASLEAQSILKVLAWRDRGGFPSKDAIDFRTLLDASSRGAYEGDVWTDPAFDLCDGDVTLAGARRLGRLAAQLLDKPALSSLLSVVTGPENRRRLASGMCGLLAPELLDAWVEGLHDLP